MRGALFSFLLLSACSSSADDFIGVGEEPDASIGTFDGDCFCAADAATPDVVDAGPKFNGGATFACHGCTCDGTLYGCLQNANPDGSCPQGGGPPVPDHMPIDDGGAPDDGGACEAGVAGSAEGGTAQIPVVCGELPVVCLPNPTCDCIAQATGFACAVDPSGDGFILTCPPPPP